MYDPSKGFEGLPFDVLSVILDHVRKHGFKSLPILRLASKAMNALVEPMAFGSVTITFTPGRAHYLQDQLSSLASGKGPNSRWTKRLYIERLLPHTNDRNDTYRFLYADQNQFLVQAIQSLHGVTWVRFDADKDGKQGPYLEVISSLAQLPKLESLCLSFSSEYDEVESLGLSSFSKLRCIRLIRQPFTQPIMNEVRRMIAQSPYLEELTIESYTWLSAVGGQTDEENPLEIDCLFDQDIQIRTFSPRLMKFTIGNDSTLSSRSVPYFRLLTQLDIGWHNGKIQDSFWEYLSSTGVVLHHLKLAVFTTAITQYLTSYTGLNALEINCRCCDEETLSPQVFSLVFPQHETTLQLLSFVEFKSSFWAITEDNLKCIIRCKALRTVTLMCYPSGDMSTLLAQIEQGLPDLRHLHLRPVESNDMQSGTFSYRGAVDALRKSVEDVQNMKFPAKLSFLIHLLSFGDPGLSPLSRLL